MIYESFKDEFVRFLEIKSIGNINIPISIEVTKLIVDQFKNFDKISLAVCRLIYP